MIVTSILCFLWILLCPCTFAASEAELEDLLYRMRSLEAPTREDRQLMEPLLQRAQRHSSRMPILEQNAIYWYMKSLNTRAPKFESNADPNWKVYRRRSESGFSMVVENFEKGNEVVHELAPLQIHQKLPSFTWHPQNLQVWFTDQRDEEYLRILAYDVPGKSMSVEVASRADNFSPALSPNGDWLVFLSNRDRLSNKDLRSAIYLKQIQQIEEYRIRGLDSYKANQKAQTHALSFVDPETIEATLQDGEKILISVEKALDEAKERRKKEASNQVLLPQVKGAVGGGVFRILKQVPFGDGVLKLVRVRQDVRLEYHHGQSREEVLSALSLQQYKNHPGPIFQTREDRLIFTQFENQVRSIHLFEPLNSVKRRISPRLEDCFHPVLSEDGSQAAFLLKRLETLFVHEVSMVNAKATPRIVEFKGADPHSTEAILRYNGRNLLGFNRLGDSQQLFPNLKPGPKNPATLPPTQNGAPSSRKRTSTNLQLAREPFSSRRIAWQIDSFPQAIREARSLEELQRLKWRFNLLHEQIRMKRKQVLDLRKDSLKVRNVAIWIRKMNGIRTLIDNAQILMELEE